MERPYKGIKMRDKMIVLECSICGKKREYKQPPRYKPLCTKCLEVEYRLRRKKSNLAMTKGRSRNKSSK